MLENTPKSDKNGNLKKEEEWMYISVELADEAGEIVVLEVVGEEIAGELRGTPDDESGVVFAPGDNVIGGGIVDQLVSLGEERGWDRLVRVQRK